MTKLSHNMLSYLRVMVGACQKDQRDDSELLARFAGVRDEGAFAALVYRHGPLVWQTCRRILGDTPDAEDAFQTTFLALAKKAGRFPVKSLAGWLHRVARQTALNADAESKRRRSLERQLRVVTQPKVERNADRTELYAALDEELVLLPEKVRVPLVLRYLEGKTLEEAARILGCSRRDLGRRLVRGESALRKQLERRGLDVGAVSVGTLLGGAGGASTLPVRLIGRTARAAVAFRSGTLTGGAVEAARAVLGSFPSSSIGTAIMRKSLWIVLACCLGLGSATLVTYRSLSAQPDELGEAGPVAAQTPGEPGPDGQAATRVDRFGDPLPAHALARMGTTRLWQSPDNRGGYRRDKGALAFSPDGKTLAAQRPGRTICLWDVATGKEIRRLTDAGTLVALSPDGQTVVTAMSMPNERTVRLWEVATGKFLRELKYQGPKREREHLDEVTFLPNGKMLAVGGFFNSRRDAGCDLWDVATGKEIIQVKADATVTVLSPDGKVLATRGGDKWEIIQLWEVATGKEIRQLTRKDGHIEALTFSPDGKTLASGHPEKICVWEVATGKKIHQLKLNPGSGGCNPIIFSPDGKTLVGGGTGHVWDVVTGKEPHSFGWADSCSKVAVFSPNGKILATMESNEWVIRLWEVATRKEISPRKGHQGAILSIAYSPDSKTLVSGSEDGTVGMWEVATGKEIRRLPRHEGYGVSSVVYSPDGKMLASGADLEGNLWEASTGKKVREFPRDIPRCFTPPLAFSPTSKIVATGGLVDTFHSFSVILRDLATGKEVYSLPTGHVGCNVGSGKVAFSPDGRLLVAPGKDNTVSFWEMATGKPIGQLDPKQPATGRDEFVQSLAFSPDGRVLATSITGEEKIHLWEMVGGKEIGQVGGPGSLKHFRHGYKLAFSLDGTILATAAQGHDSKGRIDPKVHLWEVATGKEIGQLTGHQSTVQCVAFSPDGKTLASGSDDTTCLVWDVTPFTGRLKPVPARPLPPQVLSKKQLEAAWADLAKDHPAKAYAAIRALQAVPTQAIPLLRTRVRPVAPLANPRQLQSWIADLDDNNFTVRDKARQEIEKLREPAIPALRQALEGQSSLEMKRRLKDLLAELEPKSIGGSLQSIRELRAVQVLESIGTAEAQQVLQALAKGAIGARLTGEAEAALARLTRRPAAKP